MESLIHIDTLCQECGFYDCSSDDPLKSDICKHPKCEDDESRCFVFSCPLGYEAEYADMKRVEPDFADTLTVGDWLVVEKSTSSNKSKSTICLHCKDGKVSVSSQGGTGWVLCGTCGGTGKQ